MKGYSTRSTNTEFLTLSLAANAAGGLVFTGGFNGMLDFGGGQVLITGEFKQGSLDLGGQSLTAVSQLDTYLASFQP